MVIRGQEILTTRNISLAAVLIETLPDLGFDLLNCLLQRLGDRVAPQRLVVEAAVLGREDDEGDDGDVTGAGLEEVIESCQGLDEKVSTLVTELVSPCCEEEQSLVQVEVDVTVEMTVDKIQNLNKLILNLTISFLSSPSVCILDGGSETRGICLSSHSTHSG